ncbi:hypothetical protein B0H63DRAFT_256100 [Podospora didyma]|uniref:PRISE-like Rossmann-fold domain-containing protein n=1 Tax=Podospora didyma TaxID=330526 RepID=A0AAE0KDD2_9PEZI|nr:hypothetical protein B0H63DRAFT_256100 [Podospora didyma]
MSTTPSFTGRAALVFGASGITGWAVLREALRYPTTQSFSRIIGLSNRPLDRSQLLLPDDPRLCLASGVDLNAGPDQVVAELSRIDGIQDVTDVFFAAYVQPPGTSDFEGHEILKKVNVRILETAAIAVEIACPRLQYWSLQTGGKSYGFVHAREVGLPKVPCRESDPRIPQPFADQVFYYAQYDTLKRLSEAKRWRFTEIRPDIIVGFVPGGKNAMNLAQALGLFLSFFRDREQQPGDAAAAASTATTTKVPFPGTTASYNARHTEIGQQTLGRAHIFAASQLATSTNNGELYNVGDSPPITGLSWRDKWAPLCAAFGLVGVGPQATDESNDNNQTSFSASQYMMLHQNEWDGFEAKHNLLPGIIRHTSWEFLEVMLSLASFDRQYDLSKFAEAGFQERVDVIQTYKEAFELMRAAKIIPTLL